MDIIEKLFPAFALKREILRLRIQQTKRAYDAGKPSAFYPLVGSSTAPNADIQKSGAIMRNRARNFDENLDLVTGLFDTLELNIVGNNNPIRPLVRNTDGTLNAAVNTKLTNLWVAWGLNPTIDGTLSINQALKLACRSWLRDGEFLTRFYRGVSRARIREIPFALELIEADYLPFNVDRHDAGKALIIQGVEIDKFSRPIAYHLYKKHPENLLFGVTTTETKRIPAGEIIHLKFTRRVNQIRGVTLLHAVMNRLEDLKDYEESERIAARVAAALTGYIQKPDGSMGKFEADGSRSFEMSPGMIFDNLLPGETVGTIGSNRPNPELTNFRQTMLRAVAAGTKSNASTISRDYNGTFSSQRQELLEAKPGYEGLRQQFVDDYLGKIWREFIGMLKTAGTIDDKGIDPETLDHIEIRGVDIGWIDPKKQADATEIAIRTGITTRGQVIRDQGGDPAAVFSEREEEQKIFGVDMPATTEGDNNGSESEENEQD